MKYLLGLYFRRVNNFQVFISIELIRFSLFIFTEIEYNLDAVLSTFRLECFLLVLIQFTFRCADNYRILRHDENVAESKSCRVIAGYIMFTRLKAQ